MSRRTCIAGIAAIALLVSACGDDDSSADAPNPFAGYQSEQYENLAHWLCHPDLPEADDVCDQDLSATVVYPDGSTEIQEHERPENPEVDCFYVYPTLSIDPSPNSDLIPNDEEFFVTINQFARYSGFCRTFAPIYRQVTLLAAFTDDFPGGDPELAYGDVLDSFKWYMAQHNDGRGFVLVSHSQGTGYARRLVDEVIEEDPYLSRRLISAHLLGGTVRIPTGSDVGDESIPGSLDSTPVCRSSEQTGCVVSFGTYREREEPVPPAVPEDGEIQRVCVNPAAPGGGEMILDPYFPLTVNAVFAAVLIQRAPNFPFAEPGGRDEITTPFISMPDFVAAECFYDPEVGHVLQARALPDPEDARADDFTGEITVSDERNLHLVDMTLTMGNLVRLGRTQAEAWLRGS
jgi:hypothetical protein